MKPEELFKFYSEAYKLKLTLRHCWIGHEERAESVADHTWSLMMLAVVIQPHLKVEIDMLRLLKMLAFHDLGEIVDGDIPATIKEGMNKEEVDAAERKGFQKIISTLTSELQEELMELWDEFAKGETPEALFANALDKAEAIMQHDLSDIDTWEDKEYQLNVNYKDHFFNFDPKIRELKDFINHYNYWLIDQAGKLDKLTPEQQKYWQENKGKFNFSFVPF
jgi:putative hydrolases of HD superfamily